MGYQPQELGKGAYGGESQTMGPISPPQPALDNQGYRPQPYGVPSEPFPGTLPAQVQQAAPGTGSVYQAPTYQPGKPDEVPGPKLQKEGSSLDDAGKLLNNIGKQQFPGSEGGPTRISDPSKPTIPMKSTLSTGGGWNGGGYQSPQWEGQAGRLAEYAQYVKKNPYRRT